MRCNRQVSGKQVTRHLVPEWTCWQVRCTSSSSTGIFVASCAKKTLLLFTRSLSVSDCSIFTRGFDAELEPGVSIGTCIGSLNVVLVVSRRIFGGWSEFASVVSTSSSFRAVTLWISGAGDPKLCASTSCLFASFACYITGVRPDLMFATKCLSYKLASPTLCRFDTCQESVEIFERNTRTESLSDDTCIETK